VPGPESFLIVGGGIVGLATAYALVQTRPNARISVLEKERSFGAHQSTHNSGVLHAGLYYKPGSLKARMAVTGIRKMTSFCRAHEIAHEICGKLVVATDAEERVRLEELMRRGQANGLSGLVLLDQDELQKREPAVRGVAAVHVPEEGIVDYRAVVGALQTQLRSRDVQLETQAHVRGLERRAGEWCATTKDGREFRAQWLINCSGLYSDRVARLAGERPTTRIVPFRGEYFKLRAERTELVRNLIYPVPDPRYPFLGVHFTRLIGGGVECGPNAVLALSREGYRGTDVNLRDTLEVLSFGGFWRFLFRHQREARRELAGSLSKTVFTRGLQRLIPEITEHDLETGGSGVRAQAMTAEGELVQDFALVRGENSLHVVNAPSPAATASLAIGEYIVERLGQRA
jgi:L-2-hydroxyglutarate oxidase